MISKNYIRVIYDGEALDRAIISIEYIWEGVLIYTFSEFSVIGISVHTTIKQLRSCNYIWSLKYKSLR